jgi:mRNA-degrading endonuclease RelE of RelBE toxin-antitoxin system
VASEHPTVEIRTTILFERELKRLAKKYPSLVADLNRLEVSLSSNPAQGTPLRRGARKLRFSISSKSKGKSGGGRIITLFLEVKRRLYLLYLYDKSEVDTVSKEFLDAQIDAALDSET